MATNETGARTANLALGLNDYYNSELIEARRRIAVVTNFGTRTSEKASAEIGTDIVDRLVDTGFDTGDILVVKAIISLNEKRHQDEFNRCRRAIGTAFAERGVSSINSTNSFNSPYEQLTPPLIKQNIDKNNATYPGQKVSYLAIVSSLSVDTLLGAAEPGETRSGGAVYIPTKGVDPETGLVAWQQIALGDRLHRLSEELLSASSQQERGYEIAAS
jgi:hypothetical protein